jgi:predicted nucleic acid-binding protein
VARRRRTRKLKARSLADALVLDAGALSAGAEGDVRIRSELLIAEQLGARVHVSSVTLAEVLRGHPRDARVHGLLSGMQLESVTPEIGRAAGALLGRTGRNDTVDAIVAVTASRIGDRVWLLTGDADDLRALTGEMPAVTVVAI